jgi:TonB family protein
MNHRKNSADRSDRFSGDAGSTDGLCRWLIHHAARHAPDSLSERLEEEWLADMAARPSTLSRLRFAIGCCWATRVIAYEQRLSLAPAAGSAAGPKSMAAFAQLNWGYLSRRSSTLFLILSLHVAVFYAVMASVSHTRTTSIPERMQTRVVENPRPIESPPTLPGVKFGKSTIDVPKPLFNFPLELTPSDGVTANFDDGLKVTLPRENPQGSPPHLMNRVQGGPGAGFPNTNDYYPAAAIRAEEQGAAIIQVCVDTNGRLTTDPITQKGSGSSRLDEAALKLARAGSGHYRATTEDGRSIDSCYPIRVRFELKR